MYSDDSDETDERNLFYVGTGFVLFLKTKSVLQAIGFQTSYLRLSDNSSKAPNKIAEISMVDNDYNDDDKINKTK